MNQAGSSADWRQGMEGGADGKHSWRRPLKLDGPLPPRRSRWVRLFGTISGLALTLFLIWLIFNFYGSSRVGVAALVVSGYSDSDMPPVGFADRDARTFLSLKGGSFFQVVDAKPSAIDGEAGRIESLKDHEDADTLIVYVNGQCELDPEQKELYLLSKDVQPDKVQLPDSKPGTTSTGRPGRVALSRLWEELNSPPLRQQKKLVLLDLCRGSPDWRLGTLPLVVDDFVLKQLKKADVPNLVVILSDRISMNSGSSRHLGDDGQSAFAYFAAQGLAGDADADGEHGKDKRISVLELFNYIQGNVRHWSAGCRDFERPQLPLLLPGPEVLKSPKFARLNFAVAACELKSNSSPNQSEIPLDELDKLYSDRDALSHENVWQRAPLEWTRLQGWLRRAEQCMLAGQGSQAKDILGKIEVLLERLEQIGRSPTDLLPKVEREYVDLVFAEKLASQYGAPPPQVAGPLTSQAELESPSQIARKFLYDESLPAMHKRDDKDTIRGEVSRLRQRADLVFSLKLGVDPWIMADRMKADEGLRKVEDLVLAHAASDVISQGLKDTKLLLNGVEDTAKEVDAANRALNLALMILPSVTQWVAFRDRSPIAESFLDTRAQDPEDHARILGRPEDLKSGEYDQGYPTLPEDSFDRIEPRLLKLLVMVRELQQIIVEPTAKADQRKMSLERMRELTPEIQKLCTGMQQQLSQRAEALGKGPQTTLQLSHLRDVEEILLLDIIPGSDRIKLLKQSIEIEKVLYVGTGELAPDKIVRDELKVRDQTADLSRTAKDCVWQTFWMIQNASLLQPELTTDRWCKQWGKLMIEIKNPEDQIVGAHQLSKEIAAGWSTGLKALKDRLNSPGDKYPAHWTNLRRADLAARILPAYETKELLTQPPSTTPTARLESAELLKRLTDLSGRCVEDYWASSTVTTGEDWYENSSSVLETCAREMLLKNPNAKWGKRELDDGKERREAVTKATLIPGMAPGESGVVNFEFASQRELQLSVQPQGAMPAGVAACWLKPLPLPPDVEPGQIVEIIPAVGQTPTNGSRRDLKFTLEKNIDGTNVDLTLVPEVRFRGHRWSTESKVSVPKVVPQGRKWEYTPSIDLASITVDGDSKRKILFVLDCSDSMKEEFKDGPQQGKRKFDQATKVLKTIIGQLEGTDEVGVANFGNQKVAFKPGQNWDADFQMRAPINPNVVKQQDACIKSLDDLVPEGVHTIALGAMRQGVEVLNQHSDDPGVLVLITDGAAQDNDANAWKAFAKKRGKHQAFIVAYAVDVNSPEMMALKKAAELNQVKFLAAPEPKELTSAIEDALTRREYFVLESNQPDRTAPLGEVVDGLTPGLYKVRFDDKEFQLELNPGQHSLLNVAWKDKEFVYNRPLEIHPTRVSLVEPPAGHMPGAPTMVSVTRFARDPQGKVQLTMAFENNDPEKGVQPPKEWLFAVFSGGKSVSANATVQSTKGSKVPAYTVEFDKWDESGAGAVVHAAWKMERTTQTTVTIPVADLLKTTVDKPLNGGRTELKISAVRKESTLEVTLQLHDKAPRDAGVPPSFPIDASMTRVELGSESQEKFNPETGLTREIEVFENGRIVARFKQNGGIADLNNKWITITLPELLLQGAYQTQGKGISVPTFDQDSVE